MACEFYIRCYQDVLCTALIKSFRCGDYMAILILFYSQCSYLYKESCFLLYMCSWNPLYYEIYPILDTFLYHCKWEHPEYNYINAPNSYLRTILKFKLERLGSSSVFLEIIPYFFCYSGFTVSSFADTDQNFPGWDV